MLSGRGPKNNEIFCSCFSGRGGVQLSAQDSSRRAWLFSATRVESWKFLKQICHARWCKLLVHHLSLLFMLFSPHSSLDAGNSVDLCCAKCKSMTCVYALQ